MTEVRGLIGVYHAEGGVRGELAYVVGRLLGTAHCSLCDITHGVVRRKSAWDAMVRRLGVPVELLHLDEMPTDVAAAVRVPGSPVVLARLADHTLAPLLAPSTLAEVGGSVTAFEEALTAALRDRGWRLAPPPCPAGA